jgi:hypothetical protein
MKKVLLFLVKSIIAEGYNVPVTTLENRHATPDLNFCHDKIANTTYTEYPKGSKSLR